MTTDYFEVKYLHKINTRQSIFIRFLPGLGSSTVDQVLKYTKYPKYIPSTSTGQVLICFKVLKYIKYKYKYSYKKLVTLYYNCVLYVGKLWQSITSLTPDDFFFLKSE